MAEILDQILLLSTFSCVSGIIPNILVPTHSPVLSSLYQSKIIYAAKNAIDGNVTTFVHASKESENWCEVKLGGLYFVSMVIVINRLDSAGVIHR